MKKEKVVGITYILSSTAGTNRLHTHMQSTTYIYIYIYIYIHRNICIEICSLHQCGATSYRIRYTLLICLNGHTTVLM